MIKGDSKRQWQMPIAKCEMQMQTQIQMWMRCLRVPVSHLCFWPLPPPFQLQSISRLGALVLQLRRCSYFQLGSYSLRVSLLLQLISSSADYPSAKLNSSPSVMAHLQIQIQPARAREQQVSRPEQALYPSQQDAYAQSIPLRVNVSLALLPHSAACRVAWSSSRRPINDPPSQALSYTVKRGPPT